jgi:hypothetical protein
MLLAGRALVPELRLVLRRAGQAAHVRPAAAAPWATARAARGEQWLLGVIVAVHKLADPTHKPVDMGSGAMRQLQRRRCPS